jgi:hypothetical protein
MPSQYQQDVLVTFGCKSEQQAHVRFAADVLSSLEGKNVIRLEWGNTDLAGGWWMDPPQKPTSSRIEYSDSQCELALRIVKHKGDITFAEAIQWVQDPSRSEELFEYVKSMVMEELAYELSVLASNGGHMRPLVVFLGEKFNVKHRWADLIVVDLFPTETKFYVFYFDDFGYREWEPFDPLSETTIEWLALGPRAYNALRKNRVESVRDLLGKTADDLLGLKPFGPAALKDVRLKLAAQGLYLKGDKPEEQEALYKAEVESRLIEELEAGTLAYNYLKRAGIQTNADLTSRTKGELTAMPNMAEHIDEIEAALAKKGLSLRAE